MNRGEPSFVFGLARPGRWPRPALELMRRTKPRPTMDVSQFLIIAGLIFVNGFFVAAEFALVKVRTSQIDQLAEQGNWAAKLTSKALDHLDAYLSASQVGITVASLALGWAIEDWVEPLVRSAFDRLGPGCRSSSTRSTGSDRCSGSCSRRSGSMSSWIIAGVSRPASCRWRRSRW